MNHDFIRLAHDMRRAHWLGLSFRIPAMTMRQLAALIAALDASEVPAQLH
ncbi:MULTISPECIES: hypothetical protein [Achromobacter]|nr:MULTISPECIES: hypothetical protein [Achromobacter]BEG77388.1 hypothetical protein HBIAX_04477 [Achromobacter xylosoxidans]